MKIPSLLYLCFWAIVSILALTSVGILLNKVDQFSSHSSEPQQILHTFLYFSLSRVFLLNPSLSWPGRVSTPALMRHMVLNCSIQLMVIGMDSSILSVFCLLPPILMLILQRNSTESINFFHYIAWVILTAFTSITYQNVDHTIKFEYYKRVLPFAVGFLIAALVSSYESELQSFGSIKVPGSTKIIVGLIGHILANHYLKDKSFILFWLVVSLAIFWLGNIAMMQSSCQPGIFEFLVGAILDIAGELFGLNIYVWLVGVGCAVLLIFFEHLDKFNLQYPGAGGADDHETRIECVDFISHVLFLYKIISRQPSEFSIILFAVITLAKFGVFIFRLMAKGPVLPQTVKDFVTFGQRDGS